jgi:hypothetical protein
MKPWEKLLSARFWIAIGVTIVYCISAIYGLLDVNKIQEITILVITFYFLRNRNYDDKGGPK